jgi:flagellar motility protein MotE (MotC chaperone)
VSVLLAVAGGRDAWAASGPDKGEQKADHGGDHKPAGAAPSAPSTTHAATPQPEKVLPGKLPPLNTVVDKSAARTRKELNKPEDAGPTLNISALRDELRRSGGEDDRPGSKKNRERLEQLSRDINKAREALRDDTARLETLLAKGEGGGGGGGDGGETSKKAPTPLDLLAKAMRGMKPEQAAPIVSRIEKKLAADILQRMPAADAGKVMGALKPETAAELAAEIAARGPRAEVRR